MSRKAKTTLTLRVTVAVPENSNSAAVMDYVRHAITVYAGGLDFQNDPLAKLDSESLKVSLLKKETDYA